LKVYTKQGDNGTSTLVDGKPLPKNSAAFAALGDLDEVNAHLGLLKSLSKSEDEIALLADVQSWIITSSAVLAGVDSMRSKCLADWAERLETAIDAMDGIVPAPKGFVLPGTCRIGAQIDIARTVTRRAERSLSSVHNVPDEVRRFVNRLSDYLYMLARYYDFIAVVRRAVEAEASKLPPVQSMRTGLSLASAKWLTERLEADAQRIGLAAVIALCDASGRPIVVHVMDDAHLISYDVAVKKAYTAVAIKIKTEELAKLAQPGGVFHSLAKANNDIMLIGGGVPLYDNGVLVGGLGISGGSAAQDIALAEFGLSAYANKGGAANGA